MSSMDASLPRACTAFRADLISSRRRSSRWDCHREARPSTAACPAGTVALGMFTIPSVSGTLGIGNRFDRRRQPMSVNGQSVPRPQPATASAAAAPAAETTQHVGAVPAQLLKAVVVGGNRIPFARTGGAYTKSSNQDMLTAALDGLIARFGLQDERIGEVAAGAVLKHSRDFNLTREAGLGSALSA